MALLEAATPQPSLGACLHVQVDLGAVHFDGVQPVDTVCFTRDLMPCEVKVREEYLLGTQALEVPNYTISWGMDLECGGDLHYAMIHLRRVLGGRFCHPAYDCNVVCSAHRAQAQQEAHGQSDSESLLPFFPFFKS